MSNRAIQPIESFLSRLASNGVQAARNVSIVSCILLLHCLAAWALDSAAANLRMRLWERGWDLPLAQFYSLHLVAVLPISILDIALVVLGARAVGLSTEEMGWKIPNRPWWGVGAALLSVPLLHVAVYGVIPKLGDIVFFQRLPAVFIKSDWTFSRLGNPQSMNRLLFSWSIFSLTEEIFFRGFIDAALMRRIGRVAGVLAGATLFALSHWRVRGGIQVAALYDVWIYGLCFSCMRLATGSLLMPILAHAGANLIQSLLHVSYRMF